MHMKKYIKLLSIEPLFKHHLEEKQVKTTIQHIKSRKERTPLLTVDKREKGYDEYVLLSGYPYFEALYNMNPDQMIFCNVISRRNRKEELYSVLKEELNSELADLNSLHYLVWELNRAEESVTTIAENIQCDLEETKKLLVDPAISSNYIYETTELDKIVLMSTIAKSKSFEEKVKEALYEWALYPKGESKSLTLSKIRNIETIFANIDPAKINTYMLESFLEGYVNDASPEFLEHWVSSQSKEFYIP